MVVVVVVVLWVRGAHPSPLIPLVRQPKAKYVRKIILAVWEQQMSSSTFFIYLYQRPIQANPVVAFKGLVTTLKLLQQVSSVVVSKPAYTCTC